MDEVQMKGERRGSGKKTKGVWEKGAEGRTEELKEAFSFYLIIQKDQITWNKNKKNKLQGYKWIMTPELLYVFPYCCYL